MSHRDQTSEFTLQDDSDKLLTRLMDIGERWKEIPHALSRQRGLILIPGETLTLPALEIGEDHVLCLGYMPGAMPLSADGLTVELAVDGGGKEEVLASLPVARDGDMSAVRSICLSLAGVTGPDRRVLLRCGAGPDNDPRGDWLAVVSLVIGVQDRVGLLSAASQYDWRLANEVERFSDAYRHAIYAERPRDAEPEARAMAAVERLPAVASRVDLSERLRRQAQERIEATLPSPGENAYAYAHRALTALLAPKPIDFAARLRELARDRPVSLLSLCAGEAGIEAQLLRDAGVPVQITLLDVSESLLQRAARAMPETAQVRLVQGDVRALDASVGRHDVVAFVSGLHHVVHLEQTLSAVHRLLHDRGEFWLIGEQVGRNGNRLWPEARRRADDLFEALPERLRLNGGSGRPDVMLPNVDFASSCFEGVRSEEIRDVVGRWFAPLCTYERNCFLWRFVDAAYVDNYDISTTEDLAALRRIVVEEFVYWSEGGRPTELNGIYVPRDRRMDVDN